jgi:hypothetical protein
MAATSASFVEALSAEEVCPLCLDRYVSADECTCIICHAPSCPGCAELIGANGAMRCYACRPPAAVNSNPALSAAKPPLVLPLPISFPAGKRTSKATVKLPFGLDALGLSLRGRRRSQALTSLGTLLARPPLRARAALALATLRSRAQRAARRAVSWVEAAQRLSWRLTHRDYRGSLSTLYSSGRRSLKKPIEALSSRILSRSKSATITPSSTRPSSTNL